MSVVIASKFNNGVIMMSDRQVTRYGIVAVKDSVEKIYNVPNTKFIMGGVGRLRTLQQVKKVSESIFTEVESVTEKNCIECLDKLTSEFRKNNYISGTEVLQELDSQFLICDGYNINFVGYDLDVINNLDYYAIGCGEDLVMGYLNTIFKDKNPSKFTYDEIRKILEESIKVSCKDSLGIDDNIDTLTALKNTMDLQSDSKIEVIDMCEWKTVKALKNNRARVCESDCSHCKYNIRFIWDNESETVIQMSKNI